MVKIKEKSLFIASVMFILLISLTYAQGLNLLFSDVDVKVAGKTSKNLEDGDTIDDEAKPGDTLEFKIEVRNNFTDEEDLKIEDITVEVTIEEIDDGDDLDEESSEFDLKPEGDKRVTLKFQVPLEVEEDTYDVIIRAEGEDENGTNHDAEMKLRLDVEKESHLLTITRASLSPAEVSCNRKNVQFSTNVINIGNEDEEDVVIEIVNSDLGINIKDEIGELTAEPNEEESRFSNVYSFNVPDDAESGSYPIILRVLFDENRKKAEESVTLTVSDCLKPKPEPEVIEEEEELTDEEDVVVVTPPPTGKTTVDVVEPTTEDIIVTQESIWKSNAFVVGIIVAEIIIVVIGIILIIALVSRRG